MVLRIRELHARNDVWRYRNLFITIITITTSIVTMAVSVSVCEIFSVNEWHDLENQVRSRSRSLKMAPFDRLSISPPL